MRPLNPFLGAALALSAAHQMVTAPRRPEDDLTVTVGEFTNAHGNRVTITEAQRKPALAHRPRKSHTASERRDRASTRAGYAATDFDEARLARAAQEHERKAKARYRQNIRGLVGYHPALGMDGPITPWVLDRLPNGGVA